MKKLVKETINFERKKDPISSLGVSRKQMIQEWLDEMGVRNYTINDDLTIDVNGNVYLGDKDLNEFPDYVQFNIVDGYFGLDQNNLESLRGCPIKCGAFACANNNLTSLDHCPREVIGAFECSGNLKKFKIGYVLSKCKVKRFSIFV